MNEPNATSTAINRLAISICFSAGLITLGIVADSSVRSILNIALLVALCIVAIIGISCLFFGSISSFYQNKQNVRTEHQRMRNLSGKAKV